METITEPPRPRRPFSKAKPRKELLAQIQRAQRLRELEGQQVHEDHVEITLAADEPIPPPPPQARPRPFAKARPRKELLAQIQRAQEMRYQEQQENIPPPEDAPKYVDNRTTFDKLVDRLDQEDRVVKASHPRSALEAVLDEDGREYNDSTIASLENIIHPVLDTPPHPRDNENIASHQATTRTPREHQSKETRREEINLASLSKQLHSTQTTIKDANRGLRRISNKIEGAEGAPQIPLPEVKIEPPAENAKSQDAPKAETALKATKPGITRKEKDAPKLETQPPAQSAVRAVSAPQVKSPAPSTITSQLDHDGRTVCAHCGGRYASVWRGLWVELRQNFYTYDTNTRFGIHLTWLGWTAATFLVWLMIESSLCVTWCDNVNGPLMPFVTHYVLLSPFRSYLKPYWRFLGWVISTVFNLDYAETIPSYGRSVPVAAATARATKRVVRSAMEAVDEMGSMWDDELI